MSLESLIITKRTSSKPEVLFKQRYEDQLLKVTPTNVVQLKGPMGF